MNETHCIACGIETDGKMKGPDDEYGPPICFNCYQNGDADEINKKTAEWLKSYEDEHK